MGLELNSDQMRELQQFIVQQNIVDQSEEEYDQEQVQEVQIDEQKDDEAKMMIDLNQLDEGEKQMLLQYLQEEYDKHPEQFPFPKEHLSKIIEQENFDLLRDQIKILQQ